MPKLSSSHGAAYYRIVIGPTRGEVPARPSLVQRGRLFFTCRRAAPPAFGSTATSKDVPSMDESLSTELAVVSAIYGEDLRSERGSDGLQARIFVRPCAEAPQVELSLQALDGYPSVAPEVSVEGLSATEAQILVERLNSRAAESLGEPMIHMLASEANCFIAEHCLGVEDGLQGGEGGGVASTSGDCGRKTETENEGQERGVGDEVREDDGERRGKGRRKEQDKSGRKREHVERPATPKKRPMREAKDVIHRIQWDPDLDVRDFAVGYLDRFLGVVEKPFAEFTWRDLATVGPAALAIPQHRIQYFKCRGEMVWSKVENFDNVFGSRGAGTTIDQVVAHKVPINNSNEGPQTQSTGGHESNPRVGEEDGSEAGGPEEEEESDADDAGSRLGQRGRYSRQNARRPNYFVCFRVTDSEITAAVRDAQDSMVASVPILAKGRLPIAALHVTLCTLRLKDEDAVARAKEVMHAVRPQLTSILPQSLGLTFAGVGTFRDRLLYVNVQDEGPVLELSKLLMRAFEAAGIALPGNHGDPKPHMTFMRLTRPMCNELGTNFIDRGLHAHLSAQWFGVQHVDGIHLCSMTEPLQANGFYVRLASVGNNLLGASPRLHDIVQHVLRGLRVDGLISANDAKLVAKELAGVADVPDKALEPVLSANRERCCHKLLLIMRGVPGSGKSCLLNRLNDWNRIHICNADKYFEQHGVYKFNAQELGAAHEYCFDRFLDGIESGEKLLAVDNTNTRLWEYSIYRRVAELCGYEVEVVELSCPDGGALKQFAVRNSHGVPYPSVQAMYERWEADPTARIVRPWLEDDTNSYDPSEQLISIFSELLAGEPGEGAPRPEVVYSAVFLTAKSIGVLLRTINPTYVNVRCDHVTLAYRPEEAHMRELPFGQRVRLKATGLVDDRQVQALAVELIDAPSIKCVNSVPHVTISTGLGAQACTANDILTHQGGAGIKPCAQVQLDGVIGCVMDIGRQCQQRVVDKGEYTRVVNSVGEPGDIEGPIFGSAAALHIFDFDGTLFDTPGPIEGKKEYMHAMGRSWPHAGWYSRSETLLPPLRIYPGPALHQLRTHCGQSGSITVVLTGRLERSREAVERILEANGVCVDKVILKDTGIANSTDDFKMQVVSNLLGDCPKIKHVKIWEDLPENLAAFHKIARRFPSIRWKIIDSLSLKWPEFEPSLIDTAPPLTCQGPSAKFGVSDYLSAAGAFPQKEHRAATRAGLRFISKVWASVINYQGSATRLIAPFGSHMLGRAGDVDLCLLAPERLAIKECLSQLRHQLERCGVKRTYIGHSKRCPRLRVCLDFATCSPVEFDIVFCRVGRDMLASGVKAADGDKLPGGVVKGDQASRAAAAGPALQSQIMKAIPDEQSMEQFAVAIEVLVRVLKARRLKGNAFHCPRTFHLVKLLARHLVEDHPSFKSSDELTVHAIELMAGLTQQDWAKVFGDTVPISYLGPLLTAFSEARAIVRSESYPTWRAVHDLLNSGQRFPPEGYCVLALRCRSRDSASLWRLSNFLEARVGSYIRALLEAGVAVIPGTTSRSKGEYRLEFGVPERSTMAAQRQCQPLVDEVRCHEARSNAWMEVRVPRDRRGPSTARLTRHHSSLSVG
eukprot:evm.model.scf_16.7 EVM.evm.TU.scf_16.7   scf_16:85314-90980(-)